MNTIHHITGMRMFCQKIIPLVYGEEMSYYETLCKIRDKLNEVIKTVNEIYDVIWNDVNSLLQEWGKEYDQKMDDLENRLTIEINNFTAEMEKQLSDNLAQVNALIAATKLYVDESIANDHAWTLEQIGKLTLEVQTNLNSLRTYVNAQDAKIYMYIDSQIEELKRLIPELQNIKVENPVTGKKEWLQDCLNYLTWVFRYFAYRAIWIDREYFTAKEIDDFDLTAWQYDIYGLKMMHTDRRWHTRSPYTGQIETSNKVIHENSVFENVLSACAEVYDNYGFTAKGYDNFGMTGSKAAEAMGLKFPITAYFYDHYFGIAENIRFRGYTAGEWYKVLYTAKERDNIQTTARFHDYFFKWNPVISDWLIKGNYLSDYWKNLGLSDQLIYLRPYRYISNQFGYYESFALKERNFKTFS